MSVERVVRRAALLAVVLSWAGCPRPPARPVAPPESFASVPDAADVGAPDTSTAPDAAQLDAAPDVGDGLVRVAGRYLALRERVRFAPDHTHVTPGSEAVLDAAAAALRALRCERVAVLGHDGVRDDRFGRQLSTDRARAVRQFLVTRGGLDEARVDAVGFELSRPLVPPSDRARSLAVNLRIEIFLAECSALGLAPAAP